MNDSEHIEKPFYWNEDEDINPKPVYAGPLVGHIAAPEPKLRRSYSSQSSDNTTCQFPNCTEKIYMGRRQGKSKYCLDHKVEVMAHRRGESAKKSYRDRKSKEK